MLLPDTDIGSTQRSSGLSSPRTSSSAARQAPAPSYLSARSADVILSEVRPTRIKTEALRSVNVLLDELLWLILGSARSFSPDRLRTGLLKVLPTVLGKDALLEAEVELRAFMERNPPATPLPTDEAAIQMFPLQQAFELLRIKCEAYSSLGDQEENIENETAIHTRMVQISGDTTLKLAAVAPAALYLTAIMEHVCEHVLSNVGRVVARDSSRTTAHSQDLYVALCEDESIYSLFKTMKVQEQIEQQSKMVRPRRSKSFSRNDLTGTMAPGTSTDTPALPKQRQSYDSVISNGSNTNLSNRASVDKSRSKVIFKTSSRTVGDNGNTNTNGAKHHRTNSLIGDKKTSMIIPVNATDANIEVSPVDDDGSMQDFDDLMRSGTTMKVSLTPDRLKTFEVFAKEKNQRANRPSVLPSTAGSPPSSFPNGHKGNQASWSRNQVESIAEAPEGDPVRLRAASITNPTSSKVDKVITTPRSRSFTDARAPSSPPPNIRSDTPEVPSTSMQSISVAMVNSSAGIPKNTRRQARNRESIDLDDLMDGSDDDMPVTRKTVLTPKSAQATTSGTRELMDFLSEGPPEPPPPSGAVSDSRAKQGRFRTIVSRLTGGSSSEKLSPRSDDSLPDTFQRASINGSLALPRGPILSKRSIPNVAAAARPLPPPIASPSLDGTFPASGLRARQTSLSRKAVPTWEALQEKADPPVPFKSVKSIPSQGDSTGVMKPLPQPAVSSPTQPSEGNTELSPTGRRASCDFVQPPKTNAVAEAKSSSPDPSLPGKTPTKGHVNADQEPLKLNHHGSSKPDRRGVLPALTLSIPAGDHVQDFRRLMAQATSAAECRVLVDMFLAKCGTLPRDEGQSSGPIVPMSPVRTEVDSHEASLIEVLLGDGGVLPLHSPATNHTQPPSPEPNEEHSSQVQPGPTPTTPPAVATGTA